MVIQMQNTEFSNVEYNAQLIVGQKYEHPDKRERLFSVSDFFYSPFSKVGNRGFVGEVEYHIDLPSRRDYLRYRNIQPHISITTRRGRKATKFMVLTCTLESFEQTTMFMGMSEDEVTRLRVAWTEQEEAIRDVCERYKL